LAALKFLTRTNFETRNSFFENSTKLLTNQIDQTITGFKNHFQETLANQVQEFTKFSETLENSNRKTVESLSHSNKKTAESLNENFGTKIDLALEKMRNFTKETIEIVASKVEATLKKLDESSQETVELVEAKLAKTELALELEKSRVLLLEGKIGNLEAEVKSLAEFVGKQFDEFKEILRGEMNP
jgi:hypothetical protein